MRATLRIRKETVMRNLFLLSPVGTALAGRVLSRRNRGNEMTPTVVSRVGRSRGRPGVAHALRFACASALVMLTSAAPAQALHQDPKQLPSYSFESIEIPGASVTQAWGID